MSPTASATEQFTVLYKYNGQFFFHEEVFASLYAVASDVFAGEIEDQFTVYRVLGGKASDVTNAVFCEVSAISYDREETPFKALRKFMDANGFDYFEADEASECEARAYDRQVRQDYISHVRGW